jgi:uncharacterized membrane protein
MQTRTRVAVSVTLGGAIATVAVWVLSLRGVAVPAEIATAIQTIATSLLAFFTPLPKKEDF